MSTSIKPGYVPRRSGGSGEHKAVTEFRQKLESIADNQLEDLKKINERLGKLTTPVPPKDPRREDEGEPPVDVFTAEPDPFPSEPPKEEP